MGESSEGSGTCGTRITRGGGAQSLGMSRELATCVPSVTCVLAGKKLTTPAQGCCLCEGVRGAYLGWGGPVLAVWPATAPGSHQRCSDSVGVSEGMTNERAGSALGFRRPGLQCRLHSSLAVGSWLACFLLGEALPTCKMKKRDSLVRQGPSNIPMFNFILIPETGVSHHTVLRGCCDEGPSLCR